MVKTIFVNDNKIWIDMLNETLNWVESNLLFTYDNAQLLTVNEIAKKTGYSKWHFQKKFQAASGMKLSHYVIGRRLTQGAILLKETPSSIAEVAIYCRYNSIHSFHRAFTNFFNETPKVFRKKKIEDSCKYQHKFIFLPEKESHLAR